MTEQEKISAQDSNEQQNEVDEGSMSLTEHLTELRSRVIKSLLAIVVGSCIAYFFLDGITEMLTLPVGKLYYMKPGEAFFTYLKIDIAAGFLIALPIIFYQAWEFFLPALTKNERSVMGVLVPASVLLFFAGLAFSFFLILPAALKFFMGFGAESETLQAMFSFGNYFDFVIWFLLPFGFVFELPLVIIVLGKLGMLTSEKLGKYRRYVFFMSFVIGAVVTSPDIITQIAVAIPVVLLYELGYLVVKYILRK
ncbi:MAG: twin-arginine translocase subunit TatC [Selenomonadaceae bacterium]|nr:twin-arginine translocase subunit TatC [Selenomonadaceae bacterium]